MNLHEQIAQALGWTVADARSFSLATLRDFVRPVNAALADQITQVIGSGTHIYSRNR